MKNLLSKPSHLLDDKQLERKSKILSSIDPLNSDIGLDYASHRWVLGKISNKVFVPMQRQDFDDFELPTVLAERFPSDGEYFAKIPVYRDGCPAGPIAELKPASSGRSDEEIQEEIQRIMKRSL